MIVELLLTLFSFVLLFWGAEWLVKGGAGLALRIGMSGLVVGLTVVAYGTSSPELLVSIKAAWIGQPGIAVGNVIGSNIFNIAIILGLAASIKPIKVEASVIRRDAPVMAVVTMLGMAVLWDGKVSRIEGAILALCSIIYTVWIIRASRDGVSDDNTATQKMSPWTAVPFIIVGLCILAFGSRLLVENAVIIARSLGVSEAVIGLTIIAAGTSMPELATSAIGAMRGQSDIALGNVLGSNIFNILFVLGVVSLIHPINGIVIRAVDQVFLLATALVLVPVIWTGRIIARKEGIMLLAIYAVYLFLMWPEV